MKELGGKTGVLVGLDPSVVVVNFTGTMKSN